MLKLTLHLANASLQPVTKLPTPSTWYSGMVNQCCHQYSYFHFLSLWTILGSLFQKKKFSPCHNLIHPYKKPREFYVSTNFVKECICSLALAYSIDNLCISVVAHFFSILIFPSQADSFICCSSYKYSATRNVKTSLLVDNFSLMLITRLLHCVSKW